MVEYPIHSDADAGAWLRPENMAKFARVAEEAGVDAISLTDHPALSKKWLEHGGHETLDPFTGLSYLAAFTSRLQLMTYLVVVPYRSPLLLAKCMTSLDVVSGGRATFVLGTGYLRSEFGALGVEFDEWNDLFDEASRYCAACGPPIGSCSPDGTSLPGAKSSPPVPYSGRIHHCGWAATQRGPANEWRGGARDGRRCRPTPPSRPRPGPHPWPVTTRSARH